MRNGTAARMKEIKDDPNKIKNIAEESKKGRRPYSLELFKKLLSNIKALIASWREASKQRESTKLRKQQDKLANFRASNRKIKCPSCNNSLSINAVACPKCGQPLTDIIRLNEIGRINRNQKIVATIIIVIFLLFLLGKLLPEKHDISSTQISDSEINIIISEFPKLPSASQKNLLKNINDFLSYLKNDSTLPSFENTGNNQIDEIFSKITLMLDEVNKEVASNERYYKERLESLRNEEENLRVLAEGMMFAPRGSEYLERLNRVRERIGELLIKIDEPKSKLDANKNKMDELKDKLYGVINESKPNPQVVIGSEETLIPEAYFDMGGSGTRAFIPHEVYLDAYYIERYPVTVSKYKEFCEATGCKVREQPDWSKDDYPVIVNWFEAVAYCEWAGKRLPTEAEWEKAARAGKEGLNYPWGNVLSHDYANYEGVAGRDKWEFASPVGSFPPNDYGLYDVVGNVDQWCSDWFSYTYSDAKNPTGPATGIYKVLRGGNWWLSGEYPKHFDVSARSEGDPSRAGVAAPVTGFRCARSKNSAIVDKKGGKGDGSI